MVHLSNLRPPAPAARTLAKRMHKRLAGIVTAAIAGLAVSGCGRSAGTDYFPLNAGRQWTYAITTQMPTGDTREQLRVFAEGTEEVGGSPAFLRRSDNGARWYLRADDTGVYRVAASDELQSEPVKDPDKRYVLQNPLQAGTSWRAQSVPYLLRRPMDFPPELRHNHKVEMTYTIQAVNETVEVPAGKFERSIHVLGQGNLTLFVDPVRGFQELPIVTDEWYAPGVGLVKLTRTEQVDSTHLQGGTLSMELTEVD